MTEFETKVLNINPKEIISKLRLLKAIEEEEILQKRYVFDIESEDIEWIRLRTDGKKSTITYKHKYHDNITLGKTQEIEVEVDSFDNAAKILQNIVFKNVYYQENKRQIFRLGDIEFAVDYWPNIPPLLEIEANSIEKVQEGLRLLNLDGQDAGDKDMVIIYQENGIDLHSFKELKF